MIRHKNVIATFHDVHDQIWFDQLIEFLSKQYKIVNTEELYSLMISGKNFRNVCHISVDDGHNSFYNRIFPVLEKHQIPATLFVSPKITSEQKNFWFQMDKKLNQEKMIKIIAEETRIQESKLNGIPYHPILKCLDISKIQRILERYYLETGKAPIPPQNMTVDQLSEVDGSGLVTIGAHTLQHPILSNESIEKSEYEIESSISGLNSLLGHPVEYFAYPNGLPKLDFGQREINILKKNKIKLAFSGGFNSFNRKSNLYSLPRMGFSKGTTNTLRMKIMLGKLWPYIKALRSKPEEKLRSQFLKLY